MSWLVANTVVATVLAGLLVVIARCCKPAPAVMHTLWLLVLLKLAMPPLFEVPFDLSWFADASPRVPVVVPMELSELSSPPPVEVTAAPLVPWWAWTWLAGSVGMLLFFAVGIVRGLRRLQRLGDVPASLRADVQQIADQLGVRLPLLLGDRNATSPYVWTFGRTRMVLPVAGLLRASAKARRSVLAHELAHLRRRDHWIAHVELLLACVLWWHPLFWFARSRLRLWSEMACDAWAMASVPESAIDYATMLIDAVAQQDPAVPEMAVLAVRPTARAAFERRLTMILNENVPCRAARAWWLPLTAMAASLFAVPVVAQEEEAPVRIEVRVNGKSLEKLSKKERRQVLQELLEREQGKAEEVEKIEVEDRPRSRRRARDVEVAEVAEEVGGMREQLRAGLAEAKNEILHDEDLRELGITDEVVHLIDDVVAGKGVEGSLDQIIKAAMKGAGKMVTKELESDPDLRAMGIGKLVTGLLDNERNQEMLGDFVQRAARTAMKEAMHEIRADKDLQKLGIAEDVEGLVGSLFSGGDFEGNLQRIIEKAMSQVDVDAKVRVDVDVDDEPVAPKKQGRGKKNKNPK